MRPISTIFIGGGTPSLFSSHSNFTPASTPTAKKSQLNSDKFTPNNSKIIITSTNNSCDSAKSNKSDKRYHKAQYINSTLNTQKNIAGKIIFEELIKMLALTSLPPSGPYELHQTAKILSETYKCQIIVFDGISNSKKISFMYPSIDNDELIPIYMFEPLESPNHFVFIRHYCFVLFHLCK